MNIIDTSVMKETLVELQRQGNNLNQLTKKLNERGFVDYKGELPTLKKMRKLKKKYKTITKK